MVGAAAFLEVAGREGQGVQAVPSPARATRCPAAMWAMTWAMAPTLVRHRTASGWVTRPSSVGTAGVPVRRIGASARCSQRLASAARSGPKRKDCERASWVPSKPVMMSLAPRQW